MPPTAPFTERIRGKVRTAESDRLSRLQESEAEVNAWGASRERLHSMAVSLYREAVLPLLLCLPEHFDNAEVKTAESRTGQSGIVRFEPTDRFPAATTLVFGVHCAPADRGLAVRHRLEIIPSLIDYQADDELALPMEELSRPEIVAAWVEARLLRFVDTYLELETNSYYQARNARTDPVCGAHVWTTTAECTASYAGRTLHFCSEACRTRFLEQPARFIS
jgi:YHS domain-containing protein